jgi:membrane glycosyltransferase
MQLNSFHLMYLFAATCGVLFIPIIFGFIAVMMERE